jgi:dihydrolipoamide dehydrogenase
MTREIPADLVVWCGERLPALDGLGLDSVALDVSGGRVRVDDHMRTSAPGVFAAGEITGESRWAHGAIRMAQVAVSTMLGTAERWRPQFQPTVLYTLPEAAWVGLTEEEARREGRPVRVAKLPMAANARFLTDTAGGRGLCKVVVDAETDLLLGVHVLSPSASEQIWGVLPLLEDELRASEIRELILPHPTMSEIIRDALAELR